MKRYIVRLTYGEDNGDPVDFATTDDLPEAIQYAVGQAFQRGVSDVRILDTENQVMLICERLDSGGT